jgi:hypothetical protein
VAEPPIRTLNEVSMRARLALLSVALVAGACQSSRPIVTEDTEALRVPTAQYVTLPRLARDLRLAYVGEDEGFIELCTPPDNVLLEEDSTLVMVNGERLSLVQPCIRRGEQFAVSNGDATMLMHRLGRMRETRPVAREVEALDPAALRPATPAMRAEWRTRAKPRPWRYIVVHHTATATGSAATCHKYHRRKGWSGLGYHFVIGNGSLTPDGTVEVGYRWRQQLHGAHARAHQGDDNKWNNYGIGICLVGDFRHHGPSDRQMDVLVELVRALRAEYAISVYKVVPHRDVKTTLCPGEAFPWEEFQRRIR